MRTTTLQDIALIIGILAFTAWALWPVFNIEAKRLARSCRLRGRGHVWTFYRNIHGEEIIHRGYKRSEWRCAHCPAAQFRKSLGYAP